MIVAFTNQKGGVGKSTAAIHCAAWLRDRGSVLLIDADAQQSSSAWAQLLELPCQVISDPEDLFDKLPELAQHHDHIVVDGPGGLSEIVKAILARCDLALVPCQPSGLDLRSSHKILRFVRQAQELRGGAPRAFLFLSRATPGTVLLREAKEALSEGGLPLLEATIFQRQCVADAPGQGMTVFEMSGASAKKASSEFKTLFETVWEEVNE